MAIKNLSLETIGLHVGYKDYSKITAGQIPYKKPGVLTCSGISIFGDASEVGGLATVTICKPDSQSSFPFTNSLHVQGNSRFVGDASKKPNAVYIDGDLYVSGSTDTGNKGRLASRFATADAKPKPFDLVHPTKEGYRLRYACIEGPEVGVYCRGRVKNDTEIVLPEYWRNLVHVDSISVQLQPIGAHQDIIVKRWDEEKIYLQAKAGFPINCFYHVYAERKDINPLIVEYKGDSWEDYPDPNFNPEKVDEDKRTYTDPRFAGPQNTFTG